MAPATNQANDLKAKVTELSDRFSTGQKLLMGGVTLAVVLAMVLVTRSASKTEMAALYSDLAPADAAAVTEGLTAEGTTYELADGGSTIMVPREKVYDVRLAMAAEGLPESDPKGYALLDEQGITASEFAQQVGFQRAMEGELTKTISAMDPIASATVHLAIPKDDVFAANAGKATASVMVRTKPGKTLDATQVQAIVHLVASSVQKLSPEDVTVADATGAVLAAPGVDGAAGGAGDLNTKQRTAFEQTVAGSIEQMLTPVVGAGKAKVTVSAELDHTQRKATSETFEQPSGDPAVPTRIQETTKIENYTGPGAAGNAGILGPDGTPLAEGEGVPTEYDSEQGEMRNALNRVVEETKAAPGTVQRMSVAVLVDANATDVDEVGQIQNLVTAAAGLSLQRGDTVQVSRMAFGGTEAALAEQERELAEAQAEEERQATMAMVRQGLIVAVLLSLLALVWRNMRRAARDRRPGLQAGAVREITPTPRPPEPLVLDRPVAQTPELPEAPPQIRSEEEMERERIGLQVNEMIDQQPAEVAQMLRGWLDEGKKGAR